MLARLPIALYHSLAQQNMIGSWDYPAEKTAVFAVDLKPDPDNAGGGKAIQTNHPLRWFFYGTDIR